MFFVHAISKKHSLLNVLVLFFLIFLLGFTFPAEARYAPQTDLETNLDVYLAEHMTRLKIPGASVGIVQGDQVILLKGYGTTDAGRTQPVTPQTPFYLASVSKSFTALGIMQLVEAGKLELDTPVKEILPWFQVDGEGADAITVRHLLHQTSGFSERGGYIRNLEPDAPNALETSIRALSDDTLQRVPGADFEYSNTNFDVLGLIIETVSGQMYGEYVQEHIFTPLEMMHAYTTLDEGRANQMASGFYPFFGFPIPTLAWMPYSLAVRPSAGLIASAEDMTHYVIAQLNGGRYQEAQILSPAGIETLHMPGVSLGNDVGYAMGWLTWTFEEAARGGESVPGAVSHIGTWTGFTSNVVMIPEKQIGIVLLLNSGDETRGSEYFRLGWDVALLALDQPPLAFSPSEDFVLRNGRWIGLGLIFLLGAENVLVFRRKPGLALTFLFYFIDLALVAYLFFVLLPENNSTLPLTWAFAPDIAVLYGVILLLTAGLGTLRTGLRLWTIKSVQSTTFPFGE